MRGKMKVLGWKVGEWFNEGLLYILRGSYVSMNKKIITLRSALERKTSVSGGDRRELSVCSIHPQSDAHWTKVWRSALTISKGTKTKFILV